MKTIRKTFNLSSAEAKALQLLQESGYAFPANTETGVIKQAIRAAWIFKFPGQPFPKEGESENKK